MARPSIQKASLVGGVLRNQSVNRSTEPNSPHAGHENVSHGTPATIAAADRRVEPHGAPAGLPGIPDADNLIASAIALTPFARLKSGCYDTPN